VHLLLQLVLELDDVLRQRQRVVKDEPLPLLRVAGLDAEDRVGVVVVPDLTN